MSNEDTTDHRRGCVLHRVTVQRPTPTQADIERIMAMEAPQYDLPEWVREQLQACSLAAVEDDRPMTPLQRHELTAYSAFTLGAAAERAGYDCELRPIPDHEVTP